LQLLPSLRSIPCLYSDAPIPKPIHQRGRWVHKHSPCTDTLVKTRHITRNHRYTVSLCLINHPWPFRTLRYKKNPCVSLALDLCIFNIVRKVF
jgi:hypothetical protein